MVVRLGAQLVEGHADLRRGVAALGQLGREQLFLDVAVAVAVGPVAEIAVAQLVAEQGDDAVLRGAFGFDRRRMPIFSTLPILHITTS